MLLLGDVFDLAVEVAHIVKLSQSIPPRACNTSTRLTAGDVRAMLLL